MSKKHYALVIVLGLLGLSFLGLDSFHKRQQERTSLLATLEHPAGKEVMPELITGLQNPDKHLRWRAARALGEIGPAASEAIPALIKALQDGDSDLERGDEDDMRKAAAWALESIGTAAVPDLIKMLADEHVDVRWRAACTLGNIGPATVEVVPALIKALQDGDKYMRQYAAQALGQIGAAAAEAEPALTRALQDGDEHVRRRAAGALTDLRRPSRPTSRIQC